MILFQIPILDRNPSPPSEPETAGVSLGILPISGAHEEAGGSGHSQFLISPAYIGSLVEKGVMGAEQGRNLLKYSAIPQPEGQRAEGQRRTSKAGEGVGVAATAAAVSFAPGDVAAVTSPPPSSTCAAGRRDQRASRAGSAYLYRCFGDFSPKQRSS